MKMLTDHFREDELRCRCGCGKLILHPGLAEALEDLRRELDQPMTITSACRCKAHNDRPAAEGGAGGHSKSLHVCDAAQHPGQMGCLAVDVAAPDGTYRGKLFSIAWRRGWSIGWNAKRGFLHLDRRVWIGMQQTTFDY